MLPPSPRVRLSDRKLEQLANGIAQGLEAGLPTPSAVAGAATYLLGRDATAQLHVEAERGIALSASLRSLGALDPADAALLLAGETYGGIPATLRTIAARATDRRARRRRLLLAIAYPVVMLLMAAVVVPIPTIVTDGVGAYLERALPLPTLLAAIALGSVLLARAPRDAPVRRAVTDLALRFPPTRAFLEHDAVVRFASVLGACVRAGVPLRGALTLASEATGHPRWTLLGPGLAARLDKGASVAPLLAGLPGFHTSDLATLDVGERTGRLDEALAQVAEAHRVAAQRAALITVALAAGVLGVAAVGWAVYSLITSWLGILGQLDRALH